MPLYNKAPYVVKAIESVLSQTCDDYELVIMDDGSKDDSYAIALKVVGGHPKCCLYQQENAGVSMARNNAVALSHGEYLCFLDADDWWDPFFLEEMSKLIDEFPDAGIYGTNYTVVNETKHKTGVAKVGVEKDFIKGYINYCRVYAKTLAMPLWTGAVCVPRKIFNEMGGFPKGIKYGEDFMLWIQITLKYKVVFLNESLAYYNQDVDAENRGVGKLYEPQYHMFWNLEFLSEEERTNPDFKQLVDNFRTYGLLPYYLSKEYHIAAKKELGKVDWRMQSKKIRKQYQRPLLVLRIENRVRKLGSMGKQWLFRILK